MAEHRRVDITVWRKEERSPQETNAGAQQNVRGKIHKSTLFIRGNTRISLTEFVYDRLRLSLYMSQVAHQAYPALCSKE